MPILFASKPGLVAYLTAGDVFGDAFIRRWSEARRAREVTPLEARPHPFEYELSYDC